MEDPFEPFGERRGNDRTGLGLGLSIARKAVRAHGGDIRIENLPGVGCIFTIEIPLEAAASDTRERATVPPLYDVPSITVRPSLSGTA